MCRGHRWLVPLPAQWPTLATQNRCPGDTYYALEGRRDEAAVHRDEGAADVGLQGRGREGVVSRDPDLISYCAPTRPTMAHLDELILGAEVGNNDVLAIRDAGQGDAHTPAGTFMAVSRQGLQQAATESLYQVEGGVQWTQKPLPGFLRHLDDAGTCLAWVSRANGQGPAPLA